MEDLQESRYKLEYFVKDTQVLQNFIVNLPPVCCATYFRDESFYDENAFKANVRTFIQISILWIYYIFERHAEDDLMICS